MRRVEGRGGGGSEEGRGGGSSHWESSMRGIIIYLDPGRNGVLNM